MIPILLFFGLCFFGLGDCDNEVEIIESVSYLEYGSSLIMVDMNEKNNIMRSDWDLTEYPYFGYDYVDVDMSNTSKGQVISYNDEDYFLITYWQLDENFINSENKNMFVIGSSGLYEKINDNWQVGKVFTKIFGIHGISENCPNTGRFICFDSHNTLVYLVHELDSVIKINEEETVKMNSRVFDSVRIDNDTIAFLFYPEGLMPEPKYHHFLPLTTLYFGVELTEDKPCFWDNDRRVCELEQRLDKLDIKSISNEVTHNEQ